MSDNVISIKDRKPFEAPADTEVPEDRTDKGLVQVLEQMLEDAKNGEIRRLAAITWDDEARTYRRYICTRAGIESFDPEEGLHMMGGCDLLKDALMDLVTMASEDLEDEE